MDFKETCRFFGGTVFYDDLRGDLKDIETALDREQAQTEFVSVENTAKLLLLRAIWHSLSGNFRDGHQHLDALFDRNVYPVRWVFRAHVYRFLFRTWQEHPPLIRCRGLRSAPLWMWKNRRWSKGDFTEDLIHAIEFCRNHKTDMSLLDNIEYEVVRIICVVDRDVRERLRHMHPEADDYEEHASQREQHRAKVQEVVTRLIQLRNGTWNAGLLTVSAYLSKTLFEIYRCLGHPEGILELERMKLTYEHAQDHVGIGWYWVIRGDFNMSPFFTSPLILNLDIVESLEYCGGDSSQHCSSELYPDQLDPATTSQRTHRDINSQTNLAFSESREVSNDSPREGVAAGREPGDRLSVDIDAARWCYAQADIQFSKCGSLRGAAATTLRKACVLTIQSMRPGKPTDMNSILTILEDAKALSIKAGDVQLQKLTELHILLVDSIDLDDRTCAQELGRWAERHSFDMFGLLLTRIGLARSLHMRYQVGDYFKSFNASEISRQIVKSMTVFRPTWYLVMLAQVDLLKSSGNQSMVYTWLGHLKEGAYRMAVECLMVEFDHDDTGKVFATKPDELDERRAGAALALVRLLQMTVESIVSLGPRSSGNNSFPDRDTSGILDLITAYARFCDEAALIERWREHLNLIILHQSATYFYKQQMQAGKLAGSMSALDKFCQDPEVLRATDLYIRSLRIDAALNRREMDEATAILASITDDDLIPSFDWGRSVRQRHWRLTERLRSLEMIYLSCIRVKDWERAERLTRILEDVSPGYSTSVMSYTHLWPWERCLNAGLVQEQRGSVNEAHLYFLQSWLFLALLRDRGADPEMERQMWNQPNIVRLTGALCRRSLSLGGQRSGTTKIEPTSDKRIDTEVFRIFGITVDYGTDWRAHLKEALLHVENGRPRYVWATAPGQSTISEAANEAYYNYQLWCALKSKATLTPEEDIEFQRLDLIKDELPQQIWGTKTTIEPDLESALDMQLELKQRIFPLEVETLCETIPDNAVVIATVLCDDGLGLLIVDDSGVKGGMWNSNAQTDVVEMLVLGYLDDIGKGGRYGGPHEYTSVLTLLSFFLTRPVERFIAGKDHIIWMPSGVLTRLPYGTLLFQGKPLMLAKQVSQIPSLTALRYLVLRSSEHSEQHRLSATVMARPCMPRNNTEKELPMAGIEALVVANWLGSAALNAKDVTRVEFQQHLRDSEILHISTHGFQDAGHPFNSHILLKERFRVLDMLAVHTHLKLVIFSACLSGAGHASETGDIQGFSHSILAAGANAYLGAFWETNDIATLLHMNLFYIYLLFVLDIPSLVDAWQCATKHLYELTTEEAVYLLKRIVDMWDARENRNLNPNALVPDGRTRLLRVIRDWERKSEVKMLDFKHPHIWAPFVLVGNGGLAIQSSGRQLLEHERENMPPNTTTETLREMFKSNDLPGQITTVTDPVKL